MLEFDKRYLSMLSWDISSALSRLITPDIFLPYVKRMEHGTPFDIRRATARVRGAG